MKLLHLKARNVFSIGTIELDLADRGLTLITGWSYDENNGNMAGKSSLANHCITWGLYGKTVHGVRADAVVNTSIKNAKHCGVWLTFEGIDGSVYRIYRARKPASLSLAKRFGTTLPAHPTGVEWADLTKRNERDTQELIDKLLGRDHKTFIQSDFFGQGRERSFLALPGSDQKAVIEEILPLTSLNDWHVSAKSATLEAFKRQAAAEWQLGLSNERVRISHISVENAETQVTNWQSKNHIEVSVAHSQLNKIQALSADVDTELRVLKEALPTDATIVETRDTSMDFNNTLTISLNNLQTQIDMATRRIEKLTTSPDTCSMCGQDLPEKQKLKNIDLVTRTKEEREVLFASRLAKGKLMSEMNAIIGICDEAIVLEDQIKPQRQEQSLVETIARLQAASNPFDLLLTSNKQQLQVEQDINKSMAKNVELWTEQLAHCEFWVNAFSKDIKTMLFEQVCPYLEQMTNQYLEDLNNGQLKVRFSVEKTMKSGDKKDEFCVTASSSTGSSVFELFSGAEKQLTSFAVGMALSDLASLQVEGASKFMILDEPFLYQSPENCENIVNFITQKLSSKSTILLISNEDNLTGLIPNRVHITKTNGVSSIA